MSELRSRAWFGRNDRDGFSHRSWMKNQGWPPDMFSRPVIGICNTWSELNPCNAHFRELAKMRVAWVQLRPCVADPDDWPAEHIRRPALILHPASVRKSV